MQDKVYVTFGSKKHPVVARFKRVAKENGKLQYAAVFEALTMWCDKHEKTNSGDYKNDKRD